MPRSGPITMTFPPFAGATRKLVLANVAVFFTLAVMHWIAPAVTDLLTERLLLEPAAVVTGMLWQPFTYAFVQLGLLDILFGMLTLWFCGSLLEGAYGSRWIYELFFTSTIGGALIASAITFTHVFALNPHDIALGAWSGIFGLLVAIGMLFGDQEFLLFFVIRLKAKHMVTIYILIAVAVLLKGGNAFSALLQLAGALCGYLYVKFAPRRGLAFGFTERYFGLRNDYYRWKRRRAARKFEVYMRGQNREVHFDKDGRYVDPDDRRTRNPKDKSWMN
jgi:membrane associated rhomboid family serine protease